MTEGFAPSPPFEADGDLPGFKELLSSQSFLERLEAARIKRAQVLAEEAKQPNDLSGFLKSTRPWDRTTVAARPAPIFLTATRRKSEPSAPVRPLVLVGPLQTAHPGPVLDLSDAGANRAEARLPPVRISSLRLVGGIGLGLLSSAGAVVAVSSMLWDKVIVAPSAAVVATISPAETIGLPTAKEAQQMSRVAVASNRVAAPVLPQPEPVLALMTARMPVQPASAEADILPRLPKAVEATVRPAASALPFEVATSEATLPQVPVAAMRTVRDADLLDAPVLPALPDLRTEQYHLLPGSITTVRMLSAPAYLPDSAARRDLQAPSTQAPRAAPEIMLLAGAGVAAPNVAVWSAATGAATGAAAPPVLTKPQLVMATLVPDAGISDIALRPAEPLAGPSLGAEAAKFAAFTVNIHAAESMPDADLDDVTRKLAGVGFTLAEPARVTFRISRNHVRFYHAADAEAAAALASEIGGPARDFTTFEPAPPEGLIEVWLSGQGSSATKTAKSSTPTKRRQAPPSEDAQIQALRDRLILQLRSGQHL